MWSWAELLGMYWKQPCCLHSCDAGQHGFKGSHAGSKRSTSNILSSSLLSVDCLFDGPCMQYSSPLPCPVQLCIPSWCLFTACTAPQDVSWKSEIIAVGSESLNFHKPCNDVRVCAWSRINQNACVQSIVQMAPDAMIAWNEFTVLSHYIHPEAVTSPM